MTCTCHWARTIAKTIGIPTRTAPRAFHPFHPGCPAIRWRSWLIEQQSDCAACKRIEGAVQYCSLYVLIGMLPCIRFTCAILAGFSYALNGGRRPHSALWFSQPTPTNGTTTSGTIPKTMRTTWRQSLLHGFHRPAPDPYPTCCNRNTRNG